MPGTVRLINGTLLLFSYPFSPDMNNALRDAADNRVHWDPSLGGFTLATGRLDRDPALIMALTRFVNKHRLDADAATRKLLAFRKVKLTGPAPTPSGTHPISRGQLRADLLPFSTWGSNLRGMFSPREWDTLRIPVCEAAGGVCEVCEAAARTDDGRRRRPDCHELWTFEHTAGRDIQRLHRLIALCPDCHRAQHIGLAGIKNETEFVLAKLCQVNRWTIPQAQQELRRAVTEYHRRQRHTWDLDLSALRHAVTIDGYPDLYIPATERARLGNSYYRQLRPASRKPG